MGSDYTLLPFLKTATTAKLVIATFLIFVCVVAIRKNVFGTSLTLHKAPATIFFAYITAGCANIILTTFMYWYWALPICLGISLIFAFTTERDVKAAISEERIGKWGLNKEIRRIRGELFNEMSIEQQIEYREKIKDVRFSKLLFTTVTMAVPVIAILVFWALDIGYLFYPVFIG